MSEDYNPGEYIIYETCNGDDMSDNGDVTTDRSSQIPDMSELSQLTDMSQKDIEELSCQMLEVFEDDV